MTNKDTYIEKKFKCEFCFREIKEGEHWAIKGYAHIHKDCVIQETIESGKTIPVSDSAEYRAKYRAEGRDNWLNKKRAKQLVTEFLNSELMQYEDEGIRGVTSDDQFLAYGKNELRSKIRDYFSTEKGDSHDK